MTIYNILAAFFSGLAGSMGLGGGGVLVLYLVLCLSENQLTAQGINLLFFIPCAIVSVIVYSRKKLIVWKSAIPMIIGGLCGVLLGAWLTNVIHTDILGKTFGGLLLLIGLKELFGKKEKKVSN